MKRTNLDAGADERLDRLLDEELRAAVQAPPVDLRATVLQAVEEVQRAPRTVQGAARVAAAFRRILQPAWALGVAAAVLISVVVAWRSSLQPAPAELAPAPAPLAGRTLTAGPFAEPAIATPERAAAGSSVRRAKRVLAWDTGPAPADAAAASTEPYLPGAPAGDLGDPLRPLPSPPPITFAPLTSAPSVSEYARPVTDFPADNQSPAAEPGAAGRSGGTHR